MSPTFLNLTVASSRARTFVYTCGLLLLCFFSTAQELYLTVTPTNQTCPGNGALTFSVSNAEPSPPVNYKVYKLPDTNNAIYDNTATTAPGLTDGDYLVIATQIVNGTTYSGEQEITIEDNVEDLVYQLSGTPSTCADGVINVLVTHGNPQTYEILTGPVTKMPQPNPSFTGLPAGVYSVRVIDDCGTGIVKTVTILSAASVLEIGNAGFPDKQLPDCDHITVSHLITAQDADIPMVLPITGTFVLTPPDGGPDQTYTATAVTIAPGTMRLSVVVPFYYDTTYYYDLTVTDGCGATYYIEDNLIRQKLRILGGFDKAACNEKYMYLVPYIYGAPLTVTFTSYPDGFDPMMNPEHPGPFSGLIQYGDQDTPIPYGTYDLTVSDGCGRSETLSLVLEEFEPEPVVAVFNSDCINNLGRTEVSVVGFTMVGGSILDGPTEFTDTHTMPVDLAAYVNDDLNIEVGQLPTGTYQFEVIDECGTVYPAEVIIPDFSAGGINPISRPDCTPGRGSLRVGGSYSLTSAIVTQAPADFPETLPYDASPHISATGTLYMDNLPPGTYKVKATTNCTPEVELSSNVPSYQINSSEVTVTRYCGSFDLLVSHDSNATVLLSFWLQKLVDPETDTWGHPGTNTPYPEGSMPVGANSRLLENNETLYTIIQTGKYRVIKAFQTFGDAEAVKTCIEVLEEFEFYDDLILRDISNLTCTGDVADIEVTAEGAEPIIYEIIEKNGAPFSFNNGNNNIFTNLEAAEYTLKISDPCGNIKTRRFSVADLPSLVTASSAPTLERCDEDMDGTEEFNLSVQDAFILDGQSTNNVTITYHASYEDAVNMITIMPDVFIANSGITQVFARVTSNVNADCMAIAAFDIKVRPVPVLDMRDTWSMCEGQEAVVTADAGMDEYLWSTGETTRSISVAEPGIYSVTVKNEYGCEVTKDITVIQSTAPVISSITVDDWTDNDNVINIFLENTSGLENFEYSIDGLHYQDSSVFTGLAPGKYNIFVRDKYNCGIDIDATYLLTYPKFFTPNGDNINEKWRITFSFAEPDMYVYIFDRYGKVITAFGADSTGWDGTYNGAPLPSTDYWFIVKRQDGRELKGHFSMIR